MKTLLAVDGSENSLRAAKYTASLMKNFKDNKVTVIFVDTFSTQVKLKGGILPSNLEQMADPGIDKWVEEAGKILSDTNIPYETRILEGYDIAETISEYAREHNFEQIVMGTRGLGNIRGIVLGSVSHKITQIAPCAVTFVK